MWYFVPTCHTTRIFISATYWPLCTGKCSSRALPSTDLCPLYDRLSAPCCLLSRDWRAFNARAFFLSISLMAADRTPPVVNVCEFTTTTKKLRAREERRGQNVYDRQIDRHKARALWKARNQKKQSVSTYRVRRYINLERSRLISFRWANIQAFISI